MFASPNNASVAPFFNLFRGRNWVAVWSITVVLITYAAIEVTNRVTHTPMEGMELLCAMMAVFTIFSFMCATASLRRNSTTLQEHVHQRTKELEATVAKLETAIAAAEDANQAKSLFLANVSHELRTPLHGMLSYARFGLSDAHDSDYEEVPGYFQSILTSGESLLSMVNDLLDLAKLEAGKMEFSPSVENVNVLAENMVDEFRSLCSEKSVDVKLELPENELDVFVDVDKFRQVLRNLMSNAVKFSPEGGTVRLTVSKDGELVRAAVSDQGPGVPDDELDAIFEKFIQSTRTKTGAGGTGLGLAICREIIEGHRGRIWAENGETGGSRFVVEIPNRETDK